jgi:hypothetical protein
MSKAWLGTVAVVLASGAVVVALQRADNAALRRDVALLRLEVKSLAQAAKTAGALASRAPAAGTATATEPGTAVVVREGESPEVEKLRGEMMELRQSTQDIMRLAQLAQAAKALEKQAEAVPTNLIPAGALKNAGQATPEASTQTALWAAVSGDVDALAATLMFTASARAKADDWFAGMTAGAQQQYGSPEKVIALMIAKDAEALSGMQVLGQKEIGPDNVGVRVRIAGADGKSKDDTLLMHRSADGWKMVLPDATVEKYARQLSRGK